MRLIGALIAILFFPAFAIPSTIYVPDDHATIQGAIDAAFNGDVIVVRAGTYVENIDFVGKAITVRSEEGPALTVIDGRDPDDPDYASVVIFGSDEKEDSVLDGFTLTNGSSTYVASTERGGGICCFSNSGDATAPTIINNIITGNRADVGGGIACYRSSPTIKNNVISVNSAQHSGGGIHSTYYSSPLIVNNLITQNATLTSTGGGIYCSNSSSYPVIRHNVIGLNQADGSGGAIYSTSSCHPEIVNNLLYGNSSLERGGGIHFNASNPTKFSNNTITGNSAPEGGAIFCMSDSPDPVKFTNSIFSDNTAAVGAEIYLASWYSEITLLEINYSVVLGGQNSVFVDTGSILEWNQGMIETDPLFATGPDGDYYLSQIAAGQASDSPCVDGGDPFLALLSGTTRTDEAQDWHVADIGYHYPLDSIQSAIDAAQNGDTLVIKEGVYFENIDFLGKALTVKSESGPHRAIIDGSGKGSVATFHNGEGPDSVLDGFTLTNGLGSVFNDLHHGGGISCRGASPTLINNIIERNEAHYGAGISCDSNSSPEIRANRITLNFAELDSTACGGGIYCAGNSSPSVSSNSIYRNIASDSGGGIFADGSSPAISRNRIVENIAYSTGGGINCGSLSSDLVNNIVAHNYALRGGGILLRDSCSTNIANNTIYGNSATEGGGIRVFAGCAISIANTVIWANSATEGPSLWIGTIVSPSTVSIDYSDVEGGQASVHVRQNCTLAWGTNMIDAAPLLVDAAEGDFHLTWKSPCVGTGDDSSVIEFEDFEGDPRIAMGPVDMGADEYYYHLYHTGAVKPGLTIDIRVVAIPWSSVSLYLGAGLADPPYNTQHGDFYLQWPPLWKGSIGKPAGTGVLIVPVTVPAGWEPGSTHPLQALAGPWGGPLTGLTNLMSLQVE